MNTFFYIAVAGAIILVLVVAWGWLKSRYDGTAAARKLAAKEGWHYESRSKGNSEWSCSVPEKYAWRARETDAENHSADRDAKSARRTIEFKARIVGCEEWLLFVAGIGETANEQQTIQGAAHRFETQSIAFNKAMHVMTNDSPLAARALTLDVMDAWLHWPQIKPLDLTLTLSDGWLHIQIANRGFIDQTEPGKFLRFCDVVVKKILASVS
jgi:hypothetical protein